MIQLQSKKRGKDATMTVTMSVRLSTFRRLLILKLKRVMRKLKHIIACRLCIGTGKVLVGTHKREYTIWKRLPLVVIPKLDMILEFMKYIKEGLRERRGISS